MNKRKLEANKRIRGILSDFEKKLRMIQKFHKDNCILYIHNKRLAQIISKRYNIDYDISQKITSFVSSETMKVISNKEVNKDGEI